MDESAKKAEHPISAIFSRSDRLREGLRNLCADVECVNRVLLGAESLKDPKEEVKTPKTSFLEDVKFRFEDHIREVKEIQDVVSTIKANVVRKPK